MTKFRQQFNVTRVYNTEGEHIGYQFSREYLLGLIYDETRPFELTLCDAIKILNELRSGKRSWYKLKDLNK